MMKPIYCLLFLSLSIDAASQKSTSGGKLKPEQAIMDIRHYTIALDLNIPEKTIAGYTTIDVNMLQPTRVLLFDLLDSFHITAITVNKKKQPFTYSHNLISINLDNELPAGRASVTIWYNGKPHIAIRPPWDDGFTWTTDHSGNPWIAVTAEGTGGKNYYPCKDHPSDEPNEGAELLITVPKGLVVAGPGLLQTTTTKKDRVTYDWKTNYSINNYSILFNVGKYKVVSRDYTTVNGNKVPMQFYVLEEDSVMANHHLDVLAQTVRSREKYFGEYPWAKEKIGICETPHLGMEHQTMNAYGNKFHYEKVGGQDFDWLMDHEFGHEWWGNKVTAKDWADYWIHEGINTFGDALDVRELEGEAAYLKRFRDMALRFENKTAIVQGKDIDEETAYVGDIYGKGAFFMHTLRYVLGDSVFFPALKEFVTSPAYTYDNLVTTDDVEQFFSRKSGMNLKPLFDLFLRTTNKMEVFVKQISGSTYQVSLTNLDMTLPLKIVSGDHEQTIMVTKKPVVVKSNTLPVIDPDKYYLTRIILE
jgi:aminopeptidase N